MTCSEPWRPQQLRRCAGTRADRGSAIVLVLVSMVLMAILAGSLLQLTRFERIPQSESNIQVVVESVVAEILNQATEDVLDDAGNFLNAQFDPAGDGNGGGDEPWDFPWTHPSTAYGLQAQFEDGSTEPVWGGAMDDRWLAAQRPDFGVAAVNTVYADPRIAQPTSIHASDGTNGVWRKITNLTGLYLIGEDGTSNLSSDSNNNGTAEYGQNPVNANLVNNRDMNINTNADILVDADGDGIGDSRWEWAPLRQVGATQYVMAVRVVDLSARMDVNVAIGSTPADGTFSSAVASNTLSTNQPRGDSPSELDGAGFISLISDDSGTAIAGALGTHLGWRQALDYRRTQDTTTTDAPATGSLTYDGNSANPTAGSRHDMWERGASRVSNGFKYNGLAGSATFGFVDAFELLRGNGLNTPENTTLEDLMPTLLRRNGGQEDNYAGATAITNNNNQSWNKFAFWTLDPRKSMTMFSGSSTAAKPFRINDQRQLKVDVNEAVRTAAGRTVLRDRIDFFLTNVRDDNLLLANFPHLGTRDDFANQLTASIADYIDSDNRITTVETPAVPGSEKAGFEALPYITEVYIQRPYEVSNVGMVQNNGTDFKTVTWDVPASDGDTGYAIEIGNPLGRYDTGTSTWVGRPIRLDNVWIKFGTAAAELLTDLTPVGAALPEFLNPGEVIIVSKNSGAGTDGTLDDVSQLWGTTSGNATIVGEYTSTTVMPDGGFNISLHAEAQDTPGTALGWFYNACAVEVPSGAITEDIVDDGTGSGEFATVMVGDDTYIQTNYRGVGQGLNMMTVFVGSQGNGVARGFADSVATLTTPSLNRKDDDGTALLDDITPEFTNETKTGEPTDFDIIADQQMVWADSPRERLSWIGDLLQVPLIGPNSTASGNGTIMGAAFRDAGITATAGSAGIPELLLPYKIGPAATNPADPINDDDSLAAATTSRFGVLNIPHSLMLLEHLTTYNPATDGEDGDGQSDSGIEGNSITHPLDGTKRDFDFDADEVLKAGKLNLNTASQETIERLLPFPDLNTRRAIATQIVARRESMQQNTVANTGANNIPGLAYTSLLYEQLESIAVSPSTLGGDTFELNGERIDHSGLDTLTAGSISAPAFEDGIVNDREEEIMLTKWLAEMTDTRSDVFAAYIVVQGYPADNFSSGATESARLIIIFSRANVGGTGDRAVEIGRIPLD